MGEKYNVKCGQTGCPHNAVADCYYCGIPLCDIHLRRLESSKGTEIYCPACLTYISVSGLKDRELDRKLIPNILLVNSKKCTGCRTCELICSFVHTKEFSYENSAIRVIKNEEWCINSLIVCRHCDHPECVEVCSSGALIKNKDSGFVSFDLEKCTNCMLCMEVCPYHSIFANKDRIIVCDMCGGEPMCAKYCPAEAIEWIKKYKLGERRKIVHVINRETEGE